MWILKEIWFIANYFQLSNEITKSVYFSMRKAFSFNIYISLCMCCSWSHVPIILSLYFHSQYSMGFNCFFFGNNYLRSIGQFPKAYIFECLKRNVLIHYLFRFIIFIYFSITFWYFVFFLLILLLFYLFFVFYSLDLNW